MRRLAFLLGFIALLSPQDGEALSEPDHLVPADRSYDRAYFDLLSKKLASTPFDFGGVIVRPPFTGEYSISIYEALQNGASRYYITMRTAEQSLWQASSGGVDATKTDGIKITQTDVVIPSHVANLLREVLRAMLAETRPLATDEEPQRIIIEGPITDVMIVGSDGKVDIGQMGTFPPSGPKLSLLAKLIANLKRLCESPVSDRAGIIAEVTSNADALRRQLKLG